MIHLLALAPSGEDYFTRDSLGRIWHHDRLTGLDPVEVGPSSVERALSDHGYLRVEREVEGWREVERLVLDLLPRIPDLNLKVNVTVARAMLPVLDKWLVSPSERHLVAQLVNRLLVTRDVATDDDLRQALLSRSQAALGAAELNPRVRRGTAAQSRHEKVLEYYIPRTTAA